MKCFVFCLLLSISCIAHAVDCSKGVIPPKELPLNILFGPSVPVQPPPQMNPHFEGTADLHWDDDGRCMTLLNDVTYIDKRGERWMAWKGMGTDGASIPPVAWSLIGGPYEGPYRRAALVHDAACYLQTRSWHASASMFYEAMLIAGTSRVTALLMYEAVYMFGPKWTVVHSLPLVPLDKVGMAINRVRLEEGVTSDQQMHVTDTANGSLASGNRSVTVAIPPPNQVKFTANDFQTLAKQIQTKEELNPGSVTLDEIEAYTPSKTVLN